MAGNDQAHSGKEGSYPTEELLSRNAEGFMAAVQSRKTLGKQADLNKYAKGRLSGYAPQYNPRQFNNVFLREMHSSFVAHVRMLTMPNAGASHHPPTLAAEH